MCNQSGGILKKQNDLNLPKTLKSQHHYYHPFCAFFLGRHMNIEKMTHYRLNKKARSSYKQLVCYVCDQEEGFCVTCSHCKITAAHPMCLWLAGDHVSLNQKMNKSEHRLAVSVD